METVSRFGEETRCGGAWVTGRFSMEFEDRVIKDRLQSEAKRRTSGPSLISGQNMLRGIENSPFWEH